jgi:hypothetical protein
MQRSMTTSSPASLAIRAASSLRMPSCIHNTFALWRRPRARAAESRRACESNRPCRRSPESRRSSGSIVRRALPVIGVDRNDPVPMVPHVFRSEVTGAVPVGGESRDCDGAGLREDAAQTRDVVDNGHWTLAEPTSVAAGCTGNRC